MLTDASGIAVGMATNIPPHNLGEVIDGILSINRKSRNYTDELMAIIQGPDFPTGGFILGRNGLDKHMKQAEVLLRCVLKLKLKKS